MPLICPNINLPEWKSLKDDIGEVPAYLAFFRNGDVIPSVADGRRILGMAEKAEAPTAIDPQIKRLLMETGGPLSGQQKAAEIKKMAEARGVSIKAMQEIVEAQLVRLADDIARDTSLTPKQRFSSLVGLYNRQPLFSARTSTSVQNQAYSTPAPLAYAMSYAVGITPQTDVYEPTAGNGMLLIGADLKQSEANEINPERNEALKAFGVGHVHSHDATKWTPPLSFSSVVSNPPFGTIDNVNYNGFGIRKLEHLIALKAFERMADDGTGYTILGAKMMPSEKETKGAQWVFENYLYGHYNVAGNFEVSGDLYAKQGASWPVRVLLVNGRKPNPEVGKFAPKSVARLSTWDEVWAEAERLHNEIERQRAGMVSGEAPGTPVRPEENPKPAPDAGTFPMGAGRPPAPTGSGGRPVGSGKPQPAITIPAPKPIPVVSAGQPPQRPPDSQLPVPQPGGIGNTAAPVQGGSAAANGPQGGNAPAGGGPSGGGTGSVVVSGKNPLAADIASVSDDELSALIDEAISEVKAPTPIPESISEKPAATPVKKAASDLLFDVPKDKPLEAQRNQIVKLLYKLDDSPGNEARASALTERLKAIEQTLFYQSFLASKAEKKPKTTSGSKPSIRKQAKSATHSAASGLDAAMQGLNEIFGKGKNLPSSIGLPPFDEETYAKAKPHFKRAYDEFVKMGKTLKDLLVDLIRRFGEAVKPYLMRFVQELKALAEKLKTVTGTDFQIPYETRSEGTPFGLLVPKNIGVGVHEFLDTLKGRVGSLADYVANRLNKSPEEVKNGLAADQIDVVAMAFDKFENGGAVINGDETGIGKGRTAASAIAYAIFNDKVPIFFTLDPKLFSDMHGDLKDIGADVKPFILGDPGKASIVDTDGNRVFKAMGKPARDREMIRILETGLKESGYNAIFVTYPQINRQNNQQDFLLKMAERNPSIIIMDEAHAAAGDKETSMQAAFFSGGRIQKGAGAQRTIITVPGILNAPGTQSGQGGVYYLSATYAKRPENMPVYYRTSLSKAADSFSQIVGAMTRGGVALQQAVSEALAKVGEYVRRERDFTGVSYQMKSVKVASEEALKDHVDQVTDVLSEIVRFSKLLRDAVIAGGSGGPSSTAMTQSQMDMTNFASIVHNQIGQLLLAAKADSIVQEALDAKARGEKPLVFLTSTMETFLEEYARDNEIKIGQNIKLRWNELTKYALSRTLRGKEKLPNGDSVTHIIDPADFGLDRLYQSIVSLADGIESKFPVSPIDYIIQKLAAAGLRMDELTGRTSGIKYTNFETGEGVYFRFPQAKKNKMVNDFNGGASDGLLLNQSGCTGLSVHASEKFKDQRPRTMLVVQPSNDIVVVLQGFGRIKRTGMVMLGKGEDGQPFGAKYLHLVLPLQAEMRPAAKLARKMKSLNANTTSDTESAIKIDAEDIFNRYGDALISEYLDDHPELQDRLDIHIDTRPDGSPATLRDVAMKFTGRMALMPDAEQEHAYGEILPAYRQLIEQLKATGEYDLEIVVHNDWDGVLQNDQELSAGTDESNIFTASTRVQHWEITDHRHVPTGAEMSREFEKNLGSNEKLMDGWKRFTRIAQSKLDERRENLNEQLRRETDAVNRSKIEERLHRQDEAVQRWTGIVMPMIESIVRDGGEVVELVNAESGETFNGMLVDFRPPKDNRLSPSAFKFKFMLNSPGGVADITGSQFSPDKWEKKFTTLEPKDLVGGRQNARYQRYFVVGNPIRGYVATGWRGKMVRFNARDGRIITGLQMPNNWNLNQLAHDPRLELATGMAVSRFLQNTSSPVEAGDVVRISRSRFSGDYIISTSAARSTGGKIYLNDELRRVTGDFNKVGNQMTAEINTRDLPRAADIIMRIVQGRFKPPMQRGGDRDRLIQQVRDANGQQRPPAAGSVVGRGESGAGKVLAQADGVEELRALLDSGNHGLDEEQAHILRAFLDMPVASTDAMKGLRVQILDALENGWQGSYVSKLAKIAAESDPDTGVHELMHHIWTVLPDDIKAEFERIRRQSIKNLLADKDTDARLRPFLEKLLDSPTAFSRDYLALQVPKEFDPVLYPLSNAEELFTNSGSNDFKARAGSTEPGFWDKVREFLKDMLAWLKKALKMTQTREEWIRNILNGRFRITPETGLKADEAEKGSIAGGEGETTPETPIEEQDPEGEIHQIAGKKYYTQFAELLTPSDYAAGAKKLVGLVRTLALPGVEDDKNIFIVQPDGFNYDQEGAKLINELKQAIETQNQRGSDSARVAPLFVRMVNYNLDAWGKLFSKPIADELRSISAGESSLAGQRLRMMQGATADDLNNTIRNLEFNLRRTYATAFGGDAYETFFKRVMDGFRNYFTDAEIEAALGNVPEMTAMIEKAMALNVREEGGKVFRRAQALLKPKAKKRLAALEADTRVEAAVQSILDQLAKQGITPKPSKNEPLAPVEKLLLLIDPKNAAKVEKLMAGAVADAERAAGIKATMMNAETDEDRQQLMEAFKNGANPEPEMVEEGLQMPEFAHWGVFRDNMLGYSPVALKLVQKVIAGDFKGTQFTKPGTKAKPEDTRLDFNELAKAPEDEVRRVLDAYEKNIEQTMDFSQATEETKARIKEMVQREVADQLKKARERARNPMFKQPKAGRLISAEERMADMVNAKLFDDPLLDIPQMVDRVAGKSLIRRLMPKMADLVKEVLNTPSASRAAIKDRFLDILVNRYGLTGEQAQNAYAVFGKAFDAQMKLAMESAMKKAMANMTPEEQKDIPLEDGKLWKKIEQFFNVGGDDVDKLLEQVAKLKGLNVPSQAEIDKLKVMVERIQTLQSPTPAKRASILNTPNLSDEAKAKELKQEAARMAAVNIPEISRLQRELGAAWAKFTKPFTTNPLKLLPAFGWIKPTEEGKNTSAAIFQFVTANILAKFSFPVTLTSHVEQQFFYSLFYRPPAVVWQVIEDSLKKGNQVDVWGAILDAYKGVWVQLKNAVMPGLRAARAQMAGRGENRNVDGLLNGINALERANLASDELWKQGKHSQAAMTGFISLWRYALRVVGALDSFQGEQTEFQELRYQFFIEMAKQGRTRAESEMKWSEAFGNMKQEWALAVSDAHDLFDQYQTLKMPLPEKGAWGAMKAKWDKGQRDQAVKEAADYLLKQRMYDKLALFGLPVDTMRAYIIRQRLAQAWQIEPGGGVGKAFNDGMQAWKRFAMEKNMPFLPVQFARAIGNGINYYGRFLPPPFYFAFLGKVDPKTGKGADPFNETPVDRKTNLMRSLFGTFMGGLVVYLVLNRRLKVQTHYPTDKRERDKFIADGHKVGTVEWLHEDGSFTPHSLNVGPFAPWATYAVAAGAALNLADTRAKQQATADAIAAAHGLPSTPIPHDNVKDMLSVIAESGWQAIMGGSTASGMTAGYQEYGIPNANKAVASVLSPLVPGLPAYQQISRMMGVSLDKNMATVFDYMVPLPTSQARQVNVLGDPVRTPDDVQRIVQQLTGGTYPLSVKPGGTDSAEDAAGQQAYANLFGSGFRPPSINPAKGYVINDTYRAMNDSELEQYTQARGDYLKDALSQLPPNATKQQVAAAYQQANARALADVGASTVRGRAGPAPTSPQATSPAAEAPQGYAASQSAGTSARRMSSGRSLRARGGRSISRGRRPSYGKAPHSLRASRSLHLPRQKVSTGRSLRRRT